MQSNGFSALAPHQAVLTSVSISHLPHPCSALSVSSGDVLSPELVNAPIEAAGRPGDVDLFRGDLSRFFSGAALFSLQFSVQAGGIEVLSRFGDAEAPEDGSMGSLVAAEAVTEVGPHCSQK